MISSKEKERKKAFLKINTYDVKKKECTDFHVTVKLNDYFDRLAADL